MRTLAEVRLSWLFRSLAVAFAATGTLFFLFPDGTIAVMNQAGAQLGLPEAPPLAHRFWLSLGTAYMTVVTVLAWLIAGDPVGRRPMMVALGAGKAASSLTCLLYFASYDRFFVYLANFLVDGSLVLIVGFAWLAAGKISRAGGQGGASLDARSSDAGSAAPKGGLSAGDTRRLGAVLEVMVPVGPVDGAASQQLVADLEAFFAGLGAGGFAAMRFLIGYANWAPPLFFKSARTSAALPPAKRERALAAIEGSRFLLVRAPLHALKLLVMMHYYQDDDAQRAVGMDPDYLAAKLKYAEERRASGAKPALPEAGTPPALPKKAEWIH